MSAGAADYYSNIARRFGSDHIPEVLSGESYSLGDPEDRISVRRIAAPEVRTQYRDIIQTVGRFVVSNSVSPEQADSNSFRTSDEYIWNMPGWLVPQKIPGSTAKLVTGYIKDIQIEAVTPDDLPEGTFNRATKYNKQYRERDDNALLVESAELVVGRSVGRVAHLTVVAHRSNYLGSFHLCGTPFKQNDMLAASGLWQSRAIASYIEHWGLTRPVVQNVRRGQSDRGKGPRSK